MNRETWRVLGSAEAGLSIAMSRKRPALIAEVKVESQYLRYLIQDEKGLYWTGRGFAKDKRRALGILDWSPTFRGSSRSMLGVAHSSLGIAGVVETGTLTPAALSSQSSHTPDLAGGEDRARHPINHCPRTENHLGVRATTHMKEAVPQMTTVTKGTSQSPILKALPSRSTSDMTLNSPNTSVPTIRFATVAARANVPIVAVGLSFVEADFPWIALEFPIAEVPER
jgi:hypothetical protein